LQVAGSTDNADPEISSLIASATENVSAMRTYIRDSLFFSKTMKPQMADGKIHDLVTAALNIMAPRAREKGVVLEFDRNHQIHANVDVVLLQRLISNLVSNAIDASKVGAVIQVDIHSIRRRDDEPNWLQLRVIDHGEGISPENLEKMKAAFFTTKDSGDGKRGFGLGLAICRKIVHLHGGTLNISSQIGKGTTVQVDLPSGSLPVLIAAETLEEAA
jgi:signal transduction histidine kinase